MIRPLTDIVIVRRIDDSETKSKGGVIILESNPEYYRAEVVYAGTGKKYRNHRVPLDVKPGDILLYDNWTGQKTNINGEELWVMRQDHALGVLDA
jgi:chaperonin GroES